MKLLNGLLAKRLGSILLVLVLATFCFGATEVDIVPLKISHKTTVVVVGTTAEALPATALSGRKSMIIQNVSTTAVYLGNADVVANETDTGNGGMQLQSDGDSVSLDFSDDMVVYGIVATGTGTVVVWEAR